MLQLLINHNSDLQKLQSEGYDLEVRGGVIFIHHVPFLNQKHEVKSGSLAFVYDANGDTLRPPRDHTAYWIGEKPCTQLGDEVPSLINQQQNGWNGHEIAFYLSLKPYPDGRYPDFYTKITTYFTTISGHAEHKDKDACRRIRKQNTHQSSESVFNYDDTNSSRAGICGISNKLANQKVAIVGLGGTGSYLLDFLAKTPVSEIHVYDDDTFCSHNAFRAPGAPTLEQLEAAPSKVEYLDGIYSAMHRKIVAHTNRIDDQNIEELYGMDMVFICVDSVKSRNFISRHLIDNHVKFIDSGLGVDLRNSRLAGQIRVTIYDGTNESHLSNSFGKEDIEEDNVYASNIQIAELNCLAAIKMLMQWKRMLGFYASSYSTILEEIYAIEPDKLYLSCGNGKA